jgi:hypothetical protein
VVKDEDGLHDVDDPVGAAAELPEETPALQGGHGAFTEAADLGVGDVVAELPSLGTAAPKGHPDGPTGHGQEGRE